MNKIIKNINLNDFKNYSINPNLMVWDPTGDMKLPRQNTSEIRGENIDSYTISANIKIDFSSYNPYYKPKCNENECSYNHKTNYCPYKTYYKSE